MFKISNEATDWLSVMENQLWAHMTAGNVAAYSGERGHHFGFIYLFQTFGFINY